MTIKLSPSQECDGCGEKRNLEITLDRGATVQEIKNAGMLNGWREVRDNRHLCPECITEALGRKK